MSATRAYRVNEIFHSVQAEGRNAGRAAVFVRFAGCNLACRFCDTDHAKYVEMTAREINEEVERLSPIPQTLVVFTGGEPTLQLAEDEPLCPRKFSLAIETNGILPAPRWIEWKTVSPKTALSHDRLREADELKFVYGHFSDEYLCEVEAACGPAQALYLQPMADAAGRFDPLPAIEFVKAHPRWTLSLQWHKLFNIR